MADNVQINLGAGGPIISTDDIGGGVEVQRVKAQYGADGSATDVSVTTPLPASPRCSTATHTSPATQPGTTTEPVLAANANRLGAAIYNEQGVTCYIALAATATLTAYATQIPAGGYYELPFGYTGAVSGITASGTATGACTLRVTEFS